MVIDLFHRCSMDERDRVLSILNKDRSETTQEEIEWTISLMVQYGSIERAASVCRSRAGDAETHLADIPESNARETLREMCSFLIERGF